MEQLTELRNWLKARPKTSLRSGDTVNDRGCVVLFEGLDKEEKLRNAELLAKEFKREIYKVELSQVVSKYIDETEKNLSALFKKAESKQWILFFDEADALFGKRTNVGDAHDKYANQEVSYLLQKIEQHSGLIILSINNKQAIDQAFIRRLRFVIVFK